MKKSHATVWSLSLPEMYMTDVLWLMDGTEMMVADKIARVRKGPYFVIFLKAECIV